MNRLFERTIGIDYSGEGTPVQPLDGLAVCQVDTDEHAEIVYPETKRVTKWSRKEVAKWLVKQLKEEGKPTLAGIDHAFSFPKLYFQKYQEHNLSNWDSFLDDFCKHWPTDKDDAKVSDLRRENKSGKNRCGNNKWRRLTDELSGTAKSVFHFNVPGSVAHSTHAGIPWLRYIRKELGDVIHFWPFDGWVPPNGKSVIVEVYPALWSGRFRRPDGLNDHQHDAYAVAAWLSWADQNGSLAQYFKPELSREERERAEIEGWILGVPGFISDTPKLTG